MKWVNICLVKSGKFKRVWYSWTWGYCAWNSLHHKSMIEEIWKSIFIAKEQSFDCSFTWLLVLPFCTAECRTHFPRLGIVIDVVTRFCVLDVHLGHINLMRLLVPLNVTPGDFSVLDHPCRRSVAFHGKNPFFKY